MSVISLAEPIEVFRAWPPEKRAKWRKIAVEAGRLEEMMDSIGWPPFPPKKTAMLEAFFEHCEVWRRAIAVVDATEAYFSA